MTSTLFYLQVAEEGMPKSQRVNKNSFSYHTKNLAGDTKFEARRKKDVSTCSLRYYVLNFKIHSIIFRRALL